MRFVLIRHGQSGNNELYERTAGEAGRDPDTVLTDLGRRQARSLADWVAAGGLPWKLTELRCSLMTRAIQTAVPIADALDLPVVADVDLFECVGPYDLLPDGSRVSHPGSARDELIRLSPRLELPSVVGADGWWHSPVEDTKSAYVERASRVVDGLRATKPEDAVVALVTHGWFTQFLLRVLLDIDDMGGWFTVDNTGVTLLQPSRGGSSAGSHELVRLNGLDHLPPEARS